MMPDRERCCSVQMSTADGLRDKASSPASSNHWLAVAAILAAVVAAGAVMGGLRYDGALIDEYAYALPSFRLASTGALKATPTAIAPGFIPIFLSASTSSLIGNTLGAARAWVPFAVWGLGMVTYMNSIVAGASRRWALAVTLALVCNPVVLPLSAVVMTDVPYSLLVALTVLFAMKWWRRRSPGWAAMVGTTAGLSVLTRPLGIALVAACLVTPRLQQWLLGLRYGANTDATQAVVKICPRELAAMAGSLGLGIAMSLVLIYFQGGMTTSMNRYGSLALTPGISNVLKMATLFPAYSWLYMALFFLGPSLALLVQLVLVRRERRKSFSRPVLMMTVLGPTLAILLAVYGKAMPYMAWGSILARNGIGGGDRQDYPAMFWVVVTIVVALGAIGLGWILSIHSNTSMLGDDQSGRVGDGTSRGSAELLLTVLAILQLVVAAPLGLALGDERVGYDRYLIPVAVCVAPLVAARATRHAAKASIAIVVSAIVAGLTLVGIQDWIAHREVVWERLEALNREGVALDKIDGGFEWDTYHFGETEAPPGVRNSSLGWLSEYAPAIDPEWVLAMSKRPGYEVVDVVKWQSWTRSGEMFLMRRIE